MARQTGIFQVHGSIGNVRNYQLTGSRYITSALKGGPSAEQIQTLPSLDFTLKHNMEWSGMMKSVHTWFTATAAMDRRLFDKGFAGRIVQMTQHLIDQNFDYPFGKRMIDIAYNPFPPWDVYPNKYHPFKAVSSELVWLENSFTSPTWHFFMTTTGYPASLYFKSNETHFRFGACLLQLPEWKYNEVNRRYEQSPYSCDGGGAVVLSDWFLRTSTPADPIDLPVVCPNFYSGTGNNCVPHFMWIEFGQLVADVIYPTPHFGIMQGPPIRI